MTSDDDWNRFGGSRLNFMPRISVHSDMNEKSVDETNSGVGNSFRDLVVLEPMESKGAVMVERRNVPNARRLIFAVVALTVVVWLAFTLNGLRHRVSVFEAVRSSPSTVGLAVSSCNQDPFVDELEETVPGTYEVLVRTRLPDNGNECADGVSIDVDPTHETITIVDRKSGETFDLLGTGEPAPLGLNGTWRMTTVDGGHLVVVGETTAQIPEITISAGQESGVISGNFGCNNMTIDVTFAGDTITGRPETREGTAELCAIPDGSEELVLTERSLLEMLSGKPADLFLNGDHLEISTPGTNAVFERVAS